ncbi:heterokaryon incompatibility protein-domain-containing protein, partial [Cercophora newfieldiana]
AKISDRSDSDECFGFLKTCLDNCLSTHAECARPTPLSSMPRRVLKIDVTQELADGSNIALYEPPSDFHADYVALSHCWGKHQPLRSLTSNHQSLIQDGIRLTQLSPVFRDAVRVCYRMGIEHLWIDSLCIIQDSKEDWERESARMCDYYENALFTISAASSPDGSVPFLRRRPERWKQQAFPFHHDDKNKTTTVMARRRPRGPSRGSSTVQTQVEDDEALLTRAWVFQEGQLSKRVVEYTASALIWACHSKKELAEGGVKRGAYSHLCNQELSNLRADKVLETWQALVAQFSARELTHATDCLPALSGLAQKFHSQMGWRYMAGLWEEHLAVGLCWEVERSVARTETALTTDINSVKYIAPTWSWASAGQRIAFCGGWSGSLRYENLVEVEDVACQVDGLNPFGRISNGSLTLKGTAFTISLSQHSTTR